MEIFLPALHHREKSEARGLGPVAWVLDLLLIFMKMILESFDSVICNSRVNSRRGMDEWKLIGKDSPQVLKKSLHLTTMA